MKQTRLEWPRVAIFDTQKATPATAMFFRGSSILNRCPRLCRPRVLATYLEAVVPPGGDEDIFNLRVVLHSKDSLRVPQVVSLFRTVVVVTRERAYVLQSTIFVGVFSDSTGSGSRMFVDFV